MQDKKTSSDLNDNPFAEGNMLTSTLKELEKSIASAETMSNNRCDKIHRTNFRSLGRKNLNGENKIGEESFQ